MKRKTIIAVLTACMMLLTLSPAAVSAVTVTDYVRVHHSDTMGIMDEYEDYEVLQDDSYEEEYGTHYGKYAGTYAQDVAGYSDDVIDDAFDGDPDAYWNID